MGQIKNIKLHIVTDIKNIEYNNIHSSNNDNNDNKNIHLATACDVSSNPSAKSIIRQLPTFTSVLHNKNNICCGQSLSTASAEFAHQFIVVSPRQCSFTHEQEMASFSTENREISMCTRQYAQTHRRF